MRRITFRTTVFCLAWLAGMVSIDCATAQQRAADAAAPAGEASPLPDVGIESADALVLEQERVAEKFKHFQAVLLRMSELSAGTDPRRAALLKKAVTESEERVIGVQLEHLVELYRQQKLGEAKETGTTVQGDLKAVLQLLMSEDRSKQIKSERERIRQYLKEVDQIIKQQKGIQGRTAEAAEPKQLSGEQGKIARRTGELADEIRANEESSSPSGSDSDEPPGKSRAGEKRPSKSENGEPGKRSDGQPSDAKEESAKGSEGKPGEAPPQGGDRQKPGKDGQQGEAGEGQPSDQGQSQQQSQPPGQNQSQGRGQSESQPQDEPGESSAENPARQRLEAARQRMEEAQEKLDEAERSGAVEKQEEAIRELEQAKAELEEILRQIREEEIGRVLEMLEARFTRMLGMQRDVLEGTVRLDKVPAEDRDHNHEIEAGRLSSKEAEIVVEADRALGLLREDGSAVAFPEAVEQMRADMSQVADRLSRAQVDHMTQVIEEDIIAALEEMIAALKKAIEEMNQRQQQAQNREGEAQDPALVDMLSEVKMIRALQLRVNERTERYSKMIEGEQAAAPELLDALNRLAERQAKIYQVTRDLEMGKNR